MNEKELQQFSERAAKTAQWIIDFAKVTMKLRTAEKNLHGVSLQHSEVKVILDGLRLLKEPREPR